MTTNYIQLNGIHPTIKFECPPDVKSVKLITHTNHVLISVPRSVEHIQFDNNFNQKIEKDVLPVGLQSIKFGSNFNQKIEKDVLPAGLQSIQFGHCFNQPIEKDVLPVGLQSIQFDNNFNQKIEKDVLPEGLQSIYFGYNFNQSIEKDVLPSGLQSIYFGTKFNQPIDNIPDKTKLIFMNIQSTMTRNYTIRQIWPIDQINNLEQEKLKLVKLLANKKENEKVGEIYTYEFYNRKYYMADVEIIKPEINKEKIVELINQLKIELHIS